MHQYSVQRRLGRGVCGESLLAVHADGLRVLKCVPIVGLSNQQQRSAYREVELLQSLSHQNVLRIYESFMHREHLVIVSDFCDAGDLDVLITKRRDSAQACSDGTQRGFSQPSVLGVFAQVAEGLHYVHYQRVVHRDLKSSNIFITGRGVGKIGDFGVAISQNLDFTTPGAELPSVGTIHHLPPEVCNGEPHTAAGDCWALGVLLYEMCALELPFTGSNVLAVALRITEGKIRALPHSYSAELRSLCKALLTVSVSKRPTAAQC